MTALLMNTLCCTHASDLFAAEFRLIGSAAVSEQFNLYRTLMEQLFPTLAFVVIIAVVLFGIRYGIAAGISSLGGVQWPRVCGGGIEWFSNTWTPIQALQNKSPWPSQ